jgi:broad specificity phosphatase PhoE
MQVYLLRNGEANYAHATDPDSAALTPLGLEQAAGLAQLCQEHAVQHLCLSTLRRSQQTADIISHAMPHLLRWDLDELEDLTLDDLMSDPSASRLVRQWTPEQYALGLKRLWARVMPVWARLQIHAQARGVERVAILGHAHILRLLLFNWLGLDWRAIATSHLRLDSGSYSRVTIVDQEPISIDWINRTF